VLNRYGLVDPDDSRLVETRRSFGYETPNERYYRERKEEQERGRKAREERQKALEARGARVGDSEDDDKMRELRKKHADLIDDTKEAHSYIKDAEEESKKASDDIYRNPRKYRNDPDRDDPFNNPHERAANIIVDAHHEHNENDDQLREVHKASGTKSPYHRVFAPGPRDTHGHDDIAHLADVHGGEAEEHSYGKGSARFSKPEEAQRFKKAAEGFHSFKDPKHNRITYSTHPEKPHVVNYEIKRDR